MEKRSKRLSIPIFVTPGRIFTLLLLLLLLLRIVTALEFGSHNEDYFYVYALDVGQSDATLLRCGEQTMLIDAGTATEELALRTALSRYGITHLDYLVLTHPHEDHIGNARWVIENVEVETVVLPAVPSDDYVYGLILSAASRCAQVKTAMRGQRFTLGNAEIEVLLAHAPTDTGAASDDAANNGSTVLRAVFGTQVFLFMGDAEKEAELNLLSLYDVAYLNCDFLKVGHHGSDTSTTWQLLAATTPTAAAISCGKQNTYGFPHAAVLQNLAAFGVNVYRTDQSGILVFGTDGKELRLIPPSTKGLSL